MISECQVGCGYLYCLDFSSGKSYIGITRQTPRKRFNAHAASARNGAKAAVYHAWRKYGPPELSVVAVLEDRELEVTETRAIEVFGTQWPTGYNLTSGGEMPRHTLESRSKMSAASKGTSRPCSPEKAAAISAAKMGYKHSPEAIAKMKKFKRVGRPCSQEHREKIRQAKLGKTKRQPPASEETKRKISIAHKGKKISDDVRAKISATLTGRPVPHLKGRTLSDAHRQKLKDAWVIRKGRLL